MQTATIVAVLCTLACFHGTQANLGPGPCPSKPQPMANSELPKFAGRWYQTGSFSNLFQLNGKCSQAIYTPNDQGGVDVKNIMLDKSSLQRKEISGFAILDDAHAGKLNVTLYVEGFGGVKTAPLWVLDTDYSNYAVTYSCTNFSPFHYDQGWIWSRTPVMNKENINKVNGILAANEINPKMFTPEIQNCGPLN